MAYFVALSLHLTGGLRKTYKNFGENDSCSDRDWKPRPFEYERAVAEQYTATTTVTENAYL
jgi:hypothetical protein